MTVEELRRRVVIQDPDLPGATTIRYEPVRVDDLISTLTALGYEVVVVEREE